MSIIIEETTDYSRFKLLDFNRELNLRHVNRLIKSMQKQMLDTPIKVTRNFEIIDGQHRFHALKTLKKPIRYYFVENYDLSEMIQYNKNNKNWSKDEYIRVYCEQGNENYIAYRKFKERFNFNLKINYLLLCGNPYSEISDDTFKNGMMVVKNVSEAYTIGNYIEKCFQYYDGSKKITFVIALKKVLENSNFNFNEFILKLEKNPSMMDDYPNSDGYVNAIEKIYNFRRKDKVSLRF